MSAELITAYERWLKEHKPEIAGSKKREFSKSIAELNKYHRALNRKAAIGVYGQSQSGKSFLIDSMLRDGDQKSFEISGLGAYKNLNPVTEAEATAVTCRFTTESGGQDGNLYVCELLSLGELLNIVIAGTEEFEDSISGTAISEDDIETNGRELGTDEVYDILEHFQIIESSAPEADAPLFKQLSEIIQEVMERGKVTTGGIKNIIKKLLKPYGNLVQFFEQLIHFYEDTYTEEAKVMVPQSIIPKLLNTNSMLSWNTPNAYKIGLKRGNSGIEVIEGATYDIAVLQILCSELILPLEQPHPDFLAEVDILDFPGLRALNTSGVESYSDNQIIRAIKQGKLKRTFELYSRRKEIPALILTSPIENHEARDLDKKMNLWIEEYCGENTSDNLNRFLFMVMTKSDKIIIASQSWKQNFEEKLESRFSTTYKKEFESLFIRMNEAEFTNLYMSINHEFASKILSGEELAKAREIFLNNTHVKAAVNSIKAELFKDLQREGSGIIRLIGDIHELAPAMKRVKEDNIKNSIRVILSNLLKDIQRHLYDEDTVKERESQDKKFEEFSEFIRTKKKSIMPEFILFFESCYPVNLEWQEGSDDPFAEESEVKPLAVFLDRYEASLNKHFTKHNLPKVFEFGYDDVLQDYLTSCINYLKYNNDFEIVENLIAEIKEGISHDNEVAGHILEELVKDHIISHCTGFLYQGVEENQELLTKIDNGLIFAAQKNYRTSVNFDLNANNSLKEIERKVCEYEQTI